jgi:hypothetical protein
VERQSIQRLLDGHILGPSGRFFAIARNERYGGALIEKRHDRGHRSARELTGAMRAAKSGSGMGTKPSGSCLSAGS